MNNGLYSACAGLLARTQELDVAANNLANVNTGGYKGQVPRFASLLAGGSVAHAAPARPIEISATIVRMETPPLADDRWRDPSPL